jgi:hypothetical protein
MRILLRAMRASRIRLPVAGFAFALGACASDTLAPAPRVATTSPTLSTSVAPISNHLAFWFQGWGPGIYNWAGPTTGISINVQRILMGSYFTRVLGMSDVFHPGSKEIVMNTVYGSTTVQCAQGWGSSFDADTMWVTTFCYNGVTQQDADAFYSTLVVGNNTMSGTSAFAVADRPWAASYTPDPARSFTTGTGSLLVQRIGVGDYYVNLGTGSPKGTTYLVNSVVNGAVCGIAEWKSFGIRVRCFTVDGLLSDVVNFNVLQVGGGRYSLDPYGAVYPWAFVWANQLSASSTYTPNASYARTWNGGAITVTRASVGDYTVDIGGIQNPYGDSENIQVTPFGLTYATCTVVGISDAPAGASRRVRVQCRNQQGALIDSRFTLLLLR